MSVFTKSIRWRLLLWLGFLVACLVAGFGITAFELHRRNQYEQIDLELERRIAALSSDLRPPRPPPPGEGPPGRPFEDGPPPRRDPGDTERPERFGPPRGGPRTFLDVRLPRREWKVSPATMNLFDESDAEGFYFAVWNRDAALVKNSTNIPSALPYPGQQNFAPRTETRARGVYREAYYFAGSGDCILAGRSIASDLRGMRRFAFWLMAAGGAVLALGLGGGWILATRAIRPIDDISAAAARIAEGNLSERISAADTDNELGRLGAVLNTTFARLEAAFAQQKQFTADASHELRTPLAVIISEAQTTLARERSAPEYRETVETCLEAAQQMRKLTQSLLELARFDAGQARMEKASCDLAEIARAAANLVRPLAEERGLRLQLDLAAAPVSGDADRLHQVAANLLVNAIHYNNERGEARISTRVEEGASVLAVADTGIGIAEADLPRVFERFYRADKSRSRSQGRSGLGLAIVKAIVEAHGGTITVASQPNAGTTFTARFPG